MSQCKVPLKCACKLCDRCAATFYCLRESGHSGRHKWDRYHEAWHGQDAWCKAPLPTEGGATR